VARPRSPCPMCETVPALDVRRLARNGQLRPGGTSDITWACDGKPCASIRLSAEKDALILAFQTEAGALVRQRVPLTWTACRWGGERPWFVCDVVADGRRCGRRCAVLYVAGAPLFACRLCLRLSYASQRESPSLRGLLKARKIRTRLGGGPDLFDELPSRPAGMRHETYARLRATYDAIAAQLAAGLERGGPWDWLKGF
jgi:hypothetical protein